MNEFERERDARMARNKEMLAKLGVPDSASSIRDAWRPAHFPAPIKRKPKGVNIVDPENSRRSSRHEVTAPRLVSNAST
eukprot:291537-Pyramimonas_sp.AAC.1